MNAIVNLKQGTSEWHNHRAKFRNASETPAVMGVSPWQSPYDLWLVKTGRKALEATAAMRHGTEMETAARVAFEEATGVIMQPLVVVDGPYSASLDGITISGDMLVEIKCPFKGHASDLWQTIRKGCVPEHYRLQVQHQLMVSKAKLAYLWVFDGAHGIKVPIEPDEEAHARIRLAWEAFQPYLDQDSPPPLTDQDTVIRDDSVWQQAAQEYLGWKSVVDEAQAKVDVAKAKLIKLATHCRESGCGITVTRFWKQGSIDYKRIPELRNVELEHYRGDSREEVRITQL